MRTFADVIRRWENTEVFAADVGVPGVTGRAWKNRNSIPPVHWPAVVGAADRRGLTGITRDLLARIAEAGGELPAERNEDAA